ncbi:hypothetical protein F2Q68_00026801 [Brassica cretica]|nr:hypothetical protein F2Q68_00026801 [Brassica cretica]
MYRRVVKLAHGIRNGAASVDGVDAKLWQSAPPKSDAPLITSNDLVEADGFVFGFPTSSMLDQLVVKPGPVGGLWRTQQLAGKSAKIFYSTGSQGGGLETIEEVFFQSKTTPNQRHLLQFLRFGMFIYVVIDF